jgi:hypothetical protein
MGIIWQQRMYTLIAADLYSEVWLAVSTNSGRHSVCFHKPRKSLAGAVPFGFCCGGFSSTAGYVPGNEA